MTEYMPHLITAILSILTSYALMIAKFSHEIKNYKKKVAIEHNYKQLLKIKESISKNRH